MGTKTETTVIYNQDGTTQTIEREVETKPVIMTDKQFRKHVQNQLGGGVYGQAFKAASQSTNGDVLDAYAAWSKASTYEKADVAAFTAALVSDGILTAQQRTLLVGSNNWPEA
jgi:hypothetical protein